MSKILFAQVQRITSIELIVDNKNVQNRGFRSNYKSIPILVFENEKCFIGNLDDRISGQIDNEEKITRGPPTLRIVNRKD